MESLQKLHVKDVFSKFDKHWNPWIIGELNENYVKVAKLKDDFVWHSHEKEDELFLIMKGTLIMEFRTHKVTLHEGDMIIVPKGVEHNPHTLNGEEAWVLLVEPKKTLHTGAVDMERTNNEQKWL